MAISEIGVRHQTVNESTDNDNTQKIIPSQYNDETITNNTRIN